MISHRSLRVCIDGRIPSETVGGVAQAVVGLVGALSRLTDSDDRYLVLAYQERADAIEPYIHGVCEPIWTSLSASASAATGNRLKAYLRPAHARIRRRLRWSWFYRLPVSDGTAEASGAEVMHFTHQAGFLTRLPSIYQPWDLQHWRLPEYFDPDGRAARDVHYGTLCRRAEMVAVASSSTRTDVIEHFGISPQNVQVIPAAGVLDEYPEPTAEDLAAAAEKFRLPENFVFYPARTWPHKNHLRLVEALAILAEKDLRIELVCSGGTTEHASAIMTHAAKLGVEKQIRFVGFVAPLEVRCLYNLARLLVFPSEFEGWGLPVTEAFASGLPVACSSIPSLEEYASEAAVLFAPRDVEAMAESIRRLWCDGDLRSSLIAKGHETARRFTWDRTARHFRAHYRRIAGREPTSEDEEFLREG